MRNGNFHTYALFAPQSIFCSYPTYEEWKLFYPFQSLLLRLVLILPMRNGNFFFLHCFYFFFFFVLILPMRNGNISASITIFDNFGLVLILPMRNGNSISTSFIETTVIGFLSYLWGMETKFGLRVMEETDSPFLSYLWGMETREFCYWC